MWCDNREASYVRKTQLGCAQALDADSLPGALGRVLKAGQDETESPIRLRRFYLNTSATWAVLAVCEGLVVVFA